MKKINIALVCLENIDKVIDSFENKWIQNFCMSIYRIDYMQKDKLIFAIEGQTKVIRMNKLDSKWLEYECAEREKKQKENILLITIKNANLLPDDAFEYINRRVEKLNNANIYFLIAFPTNLSNKLNYESFEKVLK